MSDLKRVCPAVRLTCHCICPASFGLRANGHGTTAAATDGAAVYRRFVALVCLQLGARDIVIRIGCVLSHCKKGEGWKRRKSELEMGLLACQGRTYVASAGTVWRRDNVSQ